MFIEINEYSNTGNKIGPIIINTNDIYYIDNYDSDYKIWELHLGQHENEDVNVKFYIKKDGYSLLKDALLNQTLKTILN